MAARYWVGGTDTWDNTAGTKWALTSGGAGGQAVPTTADDVFFDANSGAVTCTIGITAQASTLALSGFTGTLAFGTNKIQLASTANGTICTGGSGYSITGTPLVELTGAATTGTRTVTFITATEANALSFNVTAGTSGCSVAISTVVRDLDFTGFSGTLTAANRTIYGSVTLSTGMTLTGGNTQTWAATSGTKTITSNGKTWSTSHTFNGVGGTWQLVDALTAASNRTLTLTRGTFDANNQNVTTGSFSSNNSNTRTLTMGSGTWTLGDTGTIWNTATTTNLTVNADTSTIALSNTSTTAKTFAGGGLTYYNLSISATTGISDYIFTGANTFNQISSSKTVAYSITLPAATTTTVTTWSAQGSSGNLLTLKSSTYESTFTNATLAVTNTFTVNFTNVALVNLSASGIGTVTNGLVLVASDTGNWTIGSNTKIGNLLTSGTSWTVPASWDNANNNIYIFGGGGGGSGNSLNGTTIKVSGAGGGGGGYRTLSNQTYSGSVTYAIGAGGSGAAGVTSSGTSTGGTGGTTTWDSTNTATGGTGGSATGANSSTGGSGGTGTYTGGTGGIGASTSNGACGGGGGGGAAGVNGNGGNGGNGSTGGTNSLCAGGGGGGNGGGTSGGNASGSTGGSGGNNSLGTGGGSAGNNGTLGGGGGGSNSGGGGTLGGNGIDIESFIGGGGGAGAASGSSNSSSGNGLYGGGGSGAAAPLTGAVRTGSNGAQGAIIIFWGNPVASSNFFFFM